MGTAGKGMGNQSSTGHQGTGPSVGRHTEQDEIGNQIQGNNQLRGNDQARSHNERQTVPDEDPKTEGVVESFEKRDQRKR